MWLTSACGWVCRGGAAVIIMYVVAFCVVLSSNRSAAQENRGSLEQGLLIGVLGWGLVCQFGLLPPKLTHQPVTLSRSQNLQNL